MKRPPLDYHIDIMDGVRCNHCGKSFAGTMVDEAFDAFVAHWLGKHKHHPEGSPGQEMVDSWKIMAKPKGKKK